MVDETKSKAGYNRRLRGNDGRALPAAAQVVSRLIPQDNRA